MNETSPALETSPILETSPTPTDLKKHRESLGLTQLQAAYIVHAQPRAWQGWEAGDNEIPHEQYKLFCTKTK